LHFGADRRERRKARQHAPYRAALGGGPEFPGLTEISGFIDPTFELVTPEPGLELVLSRGVESASPVPEPSTWAMLLIGFVSLGYAACRRAKAVPVAYL
jgi:hypothetical protein